MTCNAWGSSSIFVSEPELSSHVRKLSRMTAGVPLGFPCIWRCLTGVYNLLAMIFSFASTPVGQHVVDCTSLWLEDAASVEMDQQVRRNDFAPFISASDCR